MKNLSTEEVLVNKVQEYLVTYFNNRDCKGSLSFFSDKASLIGTGRDEFGVDNQIQKLYERDIEQAPNDIQYEVTFNHINVINEGTGVVISKINIQTVIDNQLISLNDLRSSFMFVKDNNTWRIVHHHISLPTSEHGEDESYPLKELEERNIVLKRMVDDKTRELSDTIEELRATQESLEELNKEKDKFFSIVAHDIKGPLSSILGLTEILAKNEQNFSPDRLNKIHWNLYKSASNTNMLLENLLNWAANQMKRSHLNLQSVKPAGIIDEIIKVFSSNTLEKKIELSSKISSNYTCIADEDIFRIIVRNLISNAIKFTYSGGKIIVTAEEKQVNLLEILVIDNGIGMTEEEVEKLFKLGSSLSTIGTNNESGSGLGLIITKDLVEKLNGKMVVRSTPGKGTEIGFTMPVE